jgi:hypothetical protein
MAVLDNAPRIDTFLECRHWPPCSSDLIERTELVGAHGVNAMAMSGQYGEDVRNTLWACSCAIDMMK